MYPATDTGASAPAGREANSVFAAQGALGMALPGAPSSDGRNEPGHD